MAISIALRCLRAATKTTRCSSSLPQWGPAFDICFKEKEPPPLTKELPPLTTNRLFISGLSSFTTAERLKDIFSPFGQLLEAKVVTDKVSGKSKGFGFLKYATIKEADRARHKMNAKFLDGWVIYISPAKPREFKPPPSPPPQLEPSEDGCKKK